jgi:hypothetical protein
MSDWLKEKVYQVENLMASVISGPFGGSLQLLSPVLTNPKVSAASLATATALQATVYSNTNGTTGFQPGVTGAAKIVDLYNLPANSLTVGRTLLISIFSTHAANTNTVTVAVNVGGTGGIGATVSGGTNIISTALATQGGLAYANTMAGVTLMQAIANQQTFGSSYSASASFAITNIASTFDARVDNVINLTMNAATATTDVTVIGWYIQIL